MSTKYKTIIVEDDPMVSSINKQYLLKNESFELLDSFSNGKDAYEYCLNNQVDLAIVDYYMPIMNGTEFVKSCTDSKLDTKIIMITAANKKEEINDILRYGVVDYLIKPFTYDRFNKSLLRFEEMNKILSSINTFLSQGEIDNLFSVSSGTKNNESNELNKGLQKNTLKLIMETMNNSNDSLLTSEEIAKQVNLSRITVRRYMNYLVDNKLAVSEIDYATGGRPSIKYRLF